MHTRPERLVLVVNPLAGNGRALEVWRQLEARLPDLARHHLILTRAPNDARARIAAALAAGADRLVAIGGDGTAHLAINTILELGYSDLVSFAFVPAGTGSDLARTLEIPSDPLPAARQALAGSDRPVDVLQISTLEPTESRWAINTISTGLSGIIATYANAKPKSSSLTYFRLLLKCYFGYAAPSFVVTNDGQEVFCGPVLLLAIANGRFFGQGMPLAPQASIDDGFFDVLVVPPIPSWRVPWFLTRFLTGRHLDIPWVRTHKGRELHLRSTCGVATPYEIDGETLAPSTATIRLVPNALSIVISNSPRRPS